MRPRDSGPFPWKCRPLPRQASHCPSSAKSESHYRPCRRPRALAHRRSHHCRIQISSAKILDQDDVINYGATTYNQLLAVTSPVEGVDEIRLKVRDGLRRTAVNRLAVKVGSFSAVDINDCSAVVGPFWPRID